MIESVLKIRRVPNWNTVQEAIFIATDQLASSTPRLDAEILLAHMLSISRSYCYSHPDQPLTVEQQKQYQELIQRRAKGEPIAYIVGKKSFWNHDFIVTPDTLIPRPETELLVQLMLSELPTESELNIADLGTGAGTIALSLAKERPHWHILATDFSKEALQIAKRNAEQWSIENVEFAQGSWCLALSQVVYHAIVANPPYVESEDPHIEWGDVRFEPLSALVSGPDGLSAMREVVTNAGNYLHNGGYLMVEHGYHQGEAVRELFTTSGFERVRTERDLAGYERATLGVWSNQ